MEAVSVPEELVCGNIKCRTNFIHTGRVWSCPVCTGRWCPVCMKKDEEGSGRTVFCPHCNALLVLPRRQYQ